MRRQNKLYKYLFIFTKSSISQFKNWPALFSLATLLVVILLIFGYLFEATASTRTMYSKEQLFWYLTLNECLLVVVLWSHLIVQNDLHRGRLSSLLIKPVSYIGMVLAEVLGATSINLFTMGAVGCIFATVWTGFFPFTFTQFLIVILLSSLAVIIQTIFTLCIGFMSFWIDDASPLFWLWSKFLFIFGGLMLPLALYPPFLQTFAAYTPFPVILGGRSAAILMEPLSLTFLMGELFWIFVGLNILRLLFYRGLRHENIYGGNL